MVSEEHLENLAEVLNDLVREGRSADAVALISTRHPADQADLLEELDEDALEKVLSALQPDQAADILEHLHEDVRAEVVARMPASSLAVILDSVDDDIEADIVQHLPEERAREVLPLLEDRVVVEQLLTHEEDSAGGLMNPDVLALRRDWTVDETIRFLRTQKPDPHQPYYLYVVDDESKLQGIVSLRDIVVAEPEERLGDIMSTDVISVPASADREVAAERMRHYDLLALPVVDDEGRLLGVITPDDVLDVQVEEATEDIYRMAGLGVKEWAFSPVLESASRRVPWLAFNMVWAFAGASIISVFQDTISRVAALAIFMPMIAGQAGNAGIQTATIVVRSMALGELTPADIVHMLRKEWALGLIKGVLFGGVLATVAWVTRGDMTFGLIAGVAMFLNMMVASTTGVIIPMTLRRLGVDPAAIAGVFDTMVTDFMGFLIYLGLATIFIDRLT
ncbi:MAG TPA: magnesium transporter [Dehalococcoidia bacterium]|nr:magnesium transporter [Dehalococcoidia bacterium]